MANPDPSPATRFAPGQSGNPTGRVATRWAGLRKQIIEQTGDGKALVEFALEVYQGRMPGSAKAPDPKLRWEAFIWLAERLWGKAIQPIDMTTHEGRPAPALTPELLSQMSPAELDAIEKLGTVMMAAQAAAAPTVIDVEEP